MTKLMSCILSPLSGLWSSLEQLIMVIGHSRAAAELIRLGYIEEAKQCMLKIENYK